MRIRLLVLYLYVIVSVNLFAQFFYAFMVKNYSSKVGGMQLQNKSISGTQQEKGWEPLGYRFFLGQKNYLNLLSEMTRYYCPVVIFYLFLVL